MGVLVASGVGVAVLVGVAVSVGMEVLVGVDVTVKVGLGVLVGVGLDSTFPPHPTREALSKKLTVIAAASTAWTKTGLEIFIELLSSSESAGAYCRLVDLSSWWRF